MSTIEDVLVSLHKRQYKVDEVELRSLPNRGAFLYNRFSDPSQVKKSEQSLQETADLVHLAKCDGFETDIEVTDVEEWMKSIQKDIEQKGVWEDNNLIIDIRDLGLSGQLAADKREGLEHLIQRLDSGEIGALYLTEGVSRLSRDKDRIMPFTLLKKLKDQKCCIRTPEGILNPAIDRDWEILADDFEDATRELSIMGRRLHRRRRRSAAKGNYVGEPVVLGYILPIIGQNPDGKYKFGKMIPYEPHAELVRMITKEYIRYEGSCQRTAQALINVAIPFFESEFAYMEHYSVLRQCPEVPNGYRITPAFIKGIVNNPKYIGISHWGDTEPIVDNHEPIVPNALFFRAYDLAHAKGKPKGKTVGFEPLVFSGLLWCCNHSEPVSISSNRKERRYRCDRDYRSGKGHHCLVIQDHLIDEPVMSVVFKQLDLTPYAEEVLAKLESDVERISIETTKYRREILDLEQKLENLKPWFGCGDPEREDFYWGLYQEYKNRLNELRAKPPSDDKKTTKADILKVRTVLSSINDNRQSYSRSHLNQLIKLMVDRINIWHQNRQIEAQLIWKNGFRQSITIELPKANNAIDRSWTSDEKNLLKLSWANSSKTDIEALLPGRSWGAIESQAFKMNLKRQPGCKSRTYHAPWTSSEEAKAKELWESGVKTELIANKIGKSEDGVKQKAGRCRWKRPEDFRKKTSKVLCVGDTLEVSQGLRSQGRW